MTGRRAEEAGIGFERGRLEPAGETGSCMYYVMEGIGYIEKNNQKKDWRCQFFLLIIYGCVVLYFVLFSDRLGRVEGYSTYRYNLIHLWRYAVLSCTGTMSVRKHFLLI